MKKMIYALMALVMLVGGMECSAQTVSGKVAGHDYVDLGLPSGTKWATCNVGATKPTEYGDYFAWGETKPKEDYSRETYKWVLEAEHDAATANWDSAWRMPTLDEIEELRDGCVWEFTKDFSGTGVAGQVGTSKANGNKIFLPAAGGRQGTSLGSAGRTGLYWSSSLNGNDPTYACNLLFCDVFTDWSCRTIRYIGQSVRAVVR